MRTPQTLKVPDNTKFFSNFGGIEAAWINFFKGLRDRLISLGEEKSFELTNNQAVAADIEGLKFDSARVSQATIDYTIQRVTTGGGATELIETGEYRAVYLPTSNTWNIFQMWTSGPHDSQVVLSITSAGQVQYTSSNITGTASISKIAFRVRTMSIKGAYSEVG